MSAEPAVSAGLSDWFAGEPTAKIAPHIPRTTPLETTLLRAEIAARSLPITRLADLTPLDRLGLPVFCAVTPLARDLTTHMGKGLTPMAARVSAIMEAIERIAAETPPPESRRTSRTALLAEGKKALDPNSLALPPDTAYNADATLAWSAAIDLGRAGTPIWLPTDLVICPALDGVIGQADTNGLASGNTRLEAVLHGLCEVIERDAAGRFLFADLYAEPGDRVMPPRRIDPRTMPQESRALVDRMAGEGLQIV
ncbi:MAG: YcaO-like family protein, partial [Pseudomonadota bacterium]